MPPHHSEKLQPDQAKMLEQVARLASEAAKQTPKDGPCLAVMHLLPGVSPAEWEAFASTYGLESWLALSLDEEPAEAVEDLLARQQTMAKQRDTDALTGIPNRGFFDRKLNSEIERALRLNSELSLVTLDVDNFKSVNDTYGHACGDEVLKGLAKALQNSVRSYDTAARIGGEEFAIILPGAQGWRALNMAKRILEVFQTETFTCEGYAPFSVTFSAGVSSLSQIPKTANLHDELMKTSDQALYEAKRQGKSRVSSYADANWLDPGESLVQSHEKQFLFTNSAGG